MNLINQNTAQAMAIYNREEKKFIDCNAKLVAMFGYTSPAEFLNRPTVSFLSEQQLNKQTPVETIKRIFRHFEENEIFFTSLVGLKKNKKEFLLDVFALDNYFEDKSHIAFFFREVDIKHISAKIVLNQNLVYKTLSSSSTDFVDILEIKVHDRENFIFEGKVIDRNETMKKTLGVDDEPLIFTDIIKELTPKDFWDNNQDVYPKILQELDKHNESSYYWQLKNTEGTILHYSVSTQSVLFKNSSIVIRIFRRLSESFIQNLMTHHQQQHASNALKEVNSKALKLLQTVKDRLTAEELALLVEIETDNANA